MLYHQYVVNFGCPVGEVMFRTLQLGVHIGGNNSIFGIEDAVFFVEMLDGCFCEMVVAG